MVPDFGDPDNYIQPFSVVPKGQRKQAVNRSESKSVLFYYSDRMNKLIQAERTQQDPKPATKLRKFKLS